MWELAQQDPRPVIRGTAIWSISRLAGKEAAVWLERLQELQRIEEAPEVVAELTPAIQKLQEKAKKA